MQAHVLNHIGLLKTAKSVNNENDIETFGVQNWNEICENSLQFCLKDPKDS